MTMKILVGCFVLTAIWDSISVYQAVSQKEEEKREW